MFLPSNRRSVLIDCKQSRGTRCAFSAYCENYREISLTRSATSCLERVVSGVRARLLRALLAVLAALQTGLLLALYRAEMIPTIHIIDVKSLNIYLSPRHINIRKASPNDKCFQTKQKYFPTIHYSFVFMYFEGCFFIIAMTYLH